MYIHLFYTDKWGLFARKLANLQAAPFDLFVTLPSQRRRFAATVRADFPDAHIMIVPNRGRGTLPFIKLARVLQRHRYDSVLKLHCKSSASNQATDAYLAVVLDRLLPESPALMREMVERVSSGAADLVGPSEVYLPLDVAFASNRRRFETLLDKLCGPAPTQQVLDHPAGYGFFAGSMFWARLDTLVPLMRLRAWHFEPESGQINGTLPHALERVFSLLPRLRGGQVFEAFDGGIRPREPASANVLWWWSPTTPLPGGKIP